ncbi:FtsX-like permease family protein [Paraferrimonas haliotis]|uniref:FtsX-like permease family protein n=1 Tax=Paraferrimonas haliotis TaxID=2013866 RepID=UPI000BA9B63C|nr:FtsX-like permease family protein [Paraferrimonas haliotis]
MLNDSLKILAIMARHYRQHPIQLLGALVGLILAVSLLIGVKAINERAKDSYQNASEVLAQPAKWLIQSQTDNAFIDDSVYRTLKREGIEPIAPYLSGWLTAKNGQYIKIQGLDFISAFSQFDSNNAQSQSTQTNDNQALRQSVSLAQLLQAPFIGLVSQEFASQLDLPKDNRLRFSNGQAIQIIAIDDDRLGNGIVVDIAAAQQLLEQPGKLGYIAIFDDAVTDRIRPLLPANARLQAQDKSMDMASLTASFHLNLSAISYLAFVVGGFIAYNAIRFSLLQRQALILRLRQLGMSQRALSVALIIEQLLLCAVGVSIGLWLGLQLAHWLQPMVSVTLERLYQVNLLPGDWRMSWWWQAWGVSLIASAFALYPSLKELASKQLIARSQLTGNLGQFDSLQSKLALIGLLITLVACNILWFSQDYRLSLLATGMITLAMPMMLPWSLQACLSLIAKKVPRGLSQWFVADARQLAQGLSLAMMAMLLALSANVAMTTLVTSFDASLQRFLSQRLNADIYLRPNPNQLEAIDGFLQQHASVARLSHYYQSGLRFNNRPILVSSSETIHLQQALAMKQQQPQLWQAFDNGGVLLMSEPMALRNGLTVGQVIELDGIGRFSIGAIYYDYGNPRGQVFISESDYLVKFNDADPISIGVKLTDSAAPLTLFNQLLQRYQLTDQEIIDQKTLRETAQGMFEQTFAITLTLNSLTLIVASLGLFSAILSLTQGRLAAFALLSSLGLTQRQLLALALAQNLALLLLSGLLALPMSALLAWALIDKVTLYSFGWTVAMNWQWGDFWQLLGIAAIATLLASFAAIQWQLKQPLLTRLQEEQGQ